MAHPRPAPGDPALLGTPALCFNDLSQALAAGYQPAPATRITLQGPASATTSDIRFTVIEAILESPDAFMARVLATGDQLCSGCDVSGATAVVTLQYGVENLNRPQTLISTGSFVSAHSPPEASPSYFLLTSQAAIDPVHNGVPNAGTIGGVFSHSRFADVDKVDWRLDNPLLDSTSFSGSLPQPHGPSLLFELNFRGPQAGQIIPYGAGSAPLPSYDPNHSVPVPLPVSVPSATPPALPPLSLPTPGLPAVPTGTPALPSLPYSAPSGSSGSGSGAVNPNTPYTR